MVDIPEEVPNTCPLLDTCDRSVTKEMYDCICTSRTWMVCGNTREIRKKYQTTPREWRNIAETV